MSAVQDKILQSMSRGNEVTVTNDGATILKAVYVDNPAAKVLVGEWGRKDLFGGGRGATSSQVATFTPGRYSPIWKAG